MNYLIISLHFTFTKFWESDAICSPHTLFKTEKTWKTASSIKFNAVGHDDVSIKFFEPFLAIVVFSLIHALDYVIITYTFADVALGGTNTNTYCETSYTPFHQKSTATVISPNAYDSDSFCLSE
uniref:Uncharacterized protein n=1 Tax=Glossina austeni TaxID=7395 RepID=A0A1A9V6S3_GLOAU